MPFTEMGNSRGPHVDMWKVRNVRDTWEKSVDKCVHRSDRRCQLETELVSVLHFDSDSDHLYRLRHLEDVQREQEGWSHEVH